MPFNIDSFKANIQTDGYIKANQFEVIFVPPPILYNTNINNLGTPLSTILTASNMRFRIEQVRAPGVSLFSSDIPRYGIGPTQKMPFNAQFQETTFSILCDGFGDIWQFWYNWLRAINEFSGTDSSRVGLANRIPRYTNEYKENYSTIMQIIIYDQYGNVIHRINMYEAFPTSIRESQLSWGDNQNLMRLAVSITYSSFTLNGTAVENPVQNLINVAGGISSTLNRTVLTP